MEILTKLDLCVVLYQSADVRSTDNTPYNPVQHLILMKPKIKKFQLALVKPLSRFKSLMAIAVMIILAFSFTGCGGKTGTSSTPARVEVLQPSSYPFVIQQIYTTEDSNSEVVSDVNVGDEVVLRDQLGVVTNSVTVDGVQIKYTADESLKAGDKAQVIVYKVVRSIGSMIDSTTGGRILTNEKIERFGIVKIDKAKRSVLADLLGGAPSKATFVGSNASVSKVATVPAANLQYLKKFPFPSGYTGRAFKDYPLEQK